ncbi:MAG: hypothetical protein OHK0046_02400 [Anaerolineae bacterium]
MSDDMSEQTSPSPSDRLRMLQAQSRSNLATLIAQRSSSRFALSDERVPEEAQDRVLVVVYPQDPFVGEPEVRTMSAADIRPGLSNERIQMQDDRSELAQPDRDGNYMFWPGSPQFDQVNAFYYATFTLRMYERYARRPLPWSFPSTLLTIDPHVGDEANAFYSEQDRMLGFHNFQLDGETVSTAWSADIVSHETAHAILDGLRDLYNESFGLGPMAFHESFGDMTAMLVALHDDSLVRRLLEWTKNDLRLDNFVASVAEQLTDALIRDTVGYLRGHTVYLRNAINSLRSEPFDALAYNPTDPELQLGLQSHNYSRLFTGAFYDILAGIYDQRSQSLPAHIAIYQARNLAAHMLVAAIELGPVGEFDFRDMAKAFLSADLVLNDGHHEGILKRVFEQRNLLTAADADAFLQQMRALPELELPKTINSPLDAAAFLEEKVMPALKIDPNADLVPMAAYRNSAGYAYLTYFSPHRIVLTGPQYGEFDGANVDMFGGLTLMFDQKGKLRSSVYRPVSQEDIRQIRKMTYELVKRGLVADTNQIDQPGDREKTPLGLMVPLTQVAKGFRQLVKFPVTIDHMPARISDFVEYLDKMRTKSGLGKG